MTPGTRINPLTSNPDVMAVGATSLSLAANAGVIGAMQSAAAAEMPKQYERAKVLILCNTIDLLSLNAVAAARGRLPVRGRVSLS
jgi:hypothetical protein